MWAQDQGLPFSRAKRRNHSALGQESSLKAVGGPVCFPLFTSPTLDLSLHPHLTETTKMSYDDQFIRRGYYSQASPDSKLPGYLQQGTASPGYPPFNPYSEYGLGPLAPPQASRHQPQGYAQSDYPPDSTNGTPSQRGSTPEDRSQTCQDSVHTHRRCVHPDSPDLPYSFPIPGSQQHTAYGTHYPRPPSARRSTVGQKRTRVKVLRPITDHIPTDYQAPHLTRLKRDMSNLDVALINLAGWANNSLSDTDRAQHSLPEGGPGVILSLLRSDPGPIESVMCL